MSLVSKEWVEDVQEFDLEEKGCCTFLNRFCCVCGFFSLFCEQGIVKKYFYSISEFNSLSGP